MASNSVEAVAAAVLEAALDHTPRHRYTPEKTAYCGGCAGTFPTGLSRQINVAREILPVQVLPPRRNFLATLTPLEHDLIGLASPPPPQPLDLTELFLDVTPVQREVK